MKVKIDLKETGLNPYQIPFNYEILLEKQKLDPKNKHAYKQYLLPDGKTLLNMEIGVTEKHVMNDLISLYSNSSLLNVKTAEEMNMGHQAEALLQKEKNKYLDNGKKSLSFKVKETIDTYCRDECMDKDLISYVLLTGGGLKLKS